MNLIYTFTGSNIGDINDVSPHFLPNQQGGWSIQAAAGPSEPDKLSIKLHPYSVTAFELIGAPPLSKQ